MEPLLPSSCRASAAGPAIVTLLPEIGTPLA